MTFLTYLSPTLPLKLSNTASIFFSTHLRLGFSRPPHCGLTQCSCVKTIYGVSFRTCSPLSIVVLAQLLNNKPVRRGCPTSKPAKIAVLSRSKRSFITSLFKCYLLISKPFGAAIENYKPLVFSVHFFNYFCHIKN